MFVRFVVHTNRCFCDAFASANIWLYHVLHDNLHCLVFKEHPWFSLEAFEKLFRESASIWYLGAFALSRRNLNFFFRSLRLHQIIVVCGAVLSLSAADLHYITRFQWRCQHFFEKVFWFFNVRKSRHATAWRLIFHGGGTEIWTPDTAGMNRML